MRYTLIAHKKSAYFVLQISIKLGGIYMKDKKKDNLLLVRLSDDMKIRLSIYCLENDITISKFIRLLIDNFFRGIDNENN